MSTGLIVLGVIVAVAVFALVAYNRLVALSQRVGQAFADIDVQLKQRHDLIPNLVETVKGYAAHERGTLDDVIKARNVAMSAQGPASAGRRRREPVERRAWPGSRCRRPIPTSRPTPTSSSSPANCPISRTSSPRAVVSSTTLFRNTIPLSSNCRFRAKLDPGMDTGSRGENASNQIIEPRF